MPPRSGTGSSCTHACEARAAGCGILTQAAGGAHGMEAKRADSVCNVFAVAQQLGSGPVVPAPARSFCVVPPCCGATESGKSAAEGLGMEVAMYPGGASTERTRRIWENARADHQIVPHHGDSDVHSPRSFDYLAPAGR